MYKMLNLFSFWNPLYNDAPEPWQIGFQDGASPGFEGIVDLHDSIFFYLVVISIGVFWILGSVIRNFNIQNSPIVYKYSNHGTLKCLHAYSMKPVKPKNVATSSMWRGIMFLTHPLVARLARENWLLGVSNSDNVTQNIVEDNSPVINIKPEKFYDNAYNLKSIILAENKNKSGIYRFSNKLNGHFYIGS